MPSVRILIVSQYFWPESFRINDLALGLKERGHEVTVLTGMPNYPSGRLFPGYTIFSPTNETFEGIPILRVPLIPRGNGRRWRLALNYVSFAFCASLLAPVRCRGSFDLIFVYEPRPSRLGCLPSYSENSRVFLSCFGSRIFGQRAFPLRARFDPPGRSDGWPSSFASFIVVAISSSCSRKSSFLMSQL